MSNRLVKINYITRRSAILRHAISNGVIKLGERKLCSATVTAALLRIINVARVIRAPVIFVTYLSKGGLYSSVVAFGFNV